MSVGPMIGQLPARWTLEDARDVLDALHASGLSVAEFARQQGIDAQRLYSWRRKLGEGLRRPDSPASRLVELRVRPQPLVTTSGIEVACPSGHIIRVHDTAALDVLAAVLLAVERASC